ncbi:MAG TPA: STAS domain-containing protein [Spirochaetota bacterium]|nr:STAS domain-containing protein [Spirochaetota bacterium]HPS85763.1 STAS domain-containing protein [Spirochaetota bacterium]
MNLNYEKKGNVVVVYVDSPLDIGNSPLIQRDISTLINHFPGCNFILNMGNVEFMNSAGLGVLIISTKRLESGNRYLKVTNLNMAVKKVIQILDAHEIIDVYDSDEEAIKSLASC